MRIRWHGHSCFEIRNRVTIVTDPHDGRSIGISPPRVKADLVLVSHNHFDHNSVRTVSGAKTKIFRDPGEQRYERITVTGFPSFHDEVDGAKRGENIVFRVQKQDITFVHCGDLGKIPEDDLIEQLGPVDIMFVPVGGVFTIDADGAWSLAQRVQPKVIIPMHYRIRGLSLSLNTVDTFLGKSENIVRVGNEIDFQREDLPAELEIWVFTL